MNMKTYLYKNDDEKLISFEISNLRIGRRGIVRIVKNIPSVEILHKPKLFSWLREEVFCKFKIENHLFSIEEPFGDNSRYLVCKEPPEWCPQLELVEKAFSEA